MSNYFPIIVDASTGKLEELPVGDNLDLSGSGIYNAGANITLPIVTSTLATLAGTETFTNKTLQSDTLANSTISGTTTFSVNSTISGNLLLTSTDSPSPSDTTKASIVTAGGILANGNIGISGYGAMVGGLALGTSIFDTTLTDIPLKIEATPTGGFTQSALINRASSASAD